MPRLLPLLALALVVTPTPAETADAAEASRTAANDHDPKTHWAFKAPVRPAVPKGGGHPIDAFIRAKLDREGMKPSPEADKVTLARRLHLDLIGLPPTPAEVDAFEKDTSPDAYEKLVEKLLASPHQGERWARHWLDAARYADSDGYEKDKSRQVWAYRDWVIAAFNADMPYDRFIREQVAGDLLPNATQDSIVATGFLRMSMLNEEGGVDPEQFRMDGMFDRMDAVGKAVLGLSVACAQCHDHKFDPLTQEEYFKLFAFLNNDHEAQRVVYTPAEQMKIAGLREKLRKIDDDLRHTTPDWAARMAAWEASLPKPPAWTVVKVENAGDNSQRYIPQPDGSILAQGYAPTKFSTLMRGPSPLATITAFRLEQLNHADLPCNGPGRSQIGTSALTEFVAEVERNGKREKVKFSTATADFNPPERELEKCYDDKSGKKRVTGPVSFAIDGKDDTAWGIDAGPGRRNVPRVAVFVPEKPVSAAGATLHFSLKQNHGGWNSDDHMNHNLGRFRLSATDAAGKVVADTIPPRVREVLAIPVEKRSVSQSEAVFAHWRTVEFKAANDAVEALWKQWPEGSTSLVVQSRESPRDTRILKRGDFLRPTTPVNAGVPAWLHPLADDKETGRVALAKWLADKKSPTTARAFVNRVWQAYFGTGLVFSSDEFGTQGDKPTHPELLDWLAVEFMDPSKGPGTIVPGPAAQPWGIKHLHRLIVTSATYRQSSRVTPELLAKDPNNRLLARGPRLRVEGEVVRDIALSASGLLNPKVGGPSVFAPAPAFLFLPPASYGPFEWTEAKGTDRYRRALYTFRRRSTPYPALAVFDAPVGEQSCVKRTRTNTPLQALTALNETLFVEAARALGARAIKEGGKTDAERVRFAFRLCVSRKPTADELAVLTELLEKQRKRGTAEPAAFALVARVLLNLDETITKE